MNITRVQLWRKAPRGGAGDKVISRRDVTAQSFRPIKTESIMFRQSHRFPNEFYKSMIRKTGQNNIVWLKTGSRVCVWVCVCVRESVCVLLCRYWIHMTAFSNSILRIVGGESPRRWSGIDRAFDGCILTMLAWLSIGLRFFTDYASSTIVFSRFSLLAFFFISSSSSFSFPSLHLLSFPVTKYTYPSIVSLFSKTPLYI